MYLVIFVWQKYQHPVLFYGLDIHLLFYYITYLSPRHDAIPVVTPSRIRPYRGKIDNSLVMHLPAYVLETIMQHAAGKSLIGSAI